MPKPSSSRPDARRGSRAFSNRSGSGRSPLIDTRPLAAVQIDCAICDTIVVHSTTGAPISRPWITIAIDTGSRMVTGLHLSLHPPSAVSIDCCIRHSISPKAAYLARLGISGTWPVHGPIAAVAIDPHPSIHSAALTATLTKYNIRLMRRSTSTKTFTAIGETVLRELGRVLSPRARAMRSHPAQVDTRERVTITLRDLERVLVDFIVNVYHLSSRAGLGTSPMHAWTAATAGLPADPTAS